MIALTKFLSDEQLRTAVTKPSTVLCLQLESYSPLFCKALVDYISRVNSSSIISQPMVTENSGQQMAGLQSTFLGQQSVYWLHADSSLGKKSDDWYTFLAGYRGPNALIFATTNPAIKKGKSWITIACPVEVDARLFKELAPLFHGRMPTSFASQIFNEVRTVPLDSAFMLYQYGTLIGKNSSEFITDWLPKIAVPQQSLFTLSQALFSRNISLFFAQWKAVRDLYPLQFWLTFWSEQIWRAYCYVRLQKAGKIADAKKIGYRLPFSFLQKDWRSHTLEHLLATHQLIYDIDYQVKQGGSEDTVDLLYHRFFIKAR